MPHLSAECVASLFGLPEGGGQTATWHGHIPFARWLVRETRPRTLVELGVWRGDSYLSMCAAVKRFETGTQCLGIDSWQGDEQAGSLADAVFDELSAYHDPRFGGFSRLVRSLFDDAVPLFADRSVDVLHIDGLHTYDAVKHDFETWLPKVSERGVVLFHDTVVREEGFGVHQFWSEVSGRWPSFSFEHSHGLGVLAIGEDVPEPVKWLTSLAGAEREAVRTLFTHIGAAVVAQVHLPPGISSGYRDDAASADAVVLEERARLWDPWGKDAKAMHQMEIMRAQVEHHEAMFNAAEHELASLRASTCWRITAPLRTLTGLLKRRG